MLKWIKLRMLHYKLHWLAESIEYVQDTLVYERDHLEHLINESRKVRQKIYSLDGPKH